MLGRKIDKSALGWRTGMAMRKTLGTVFLILSICSAPVWGQSTNSYQYDVLGRLTALQAGIGTKANYSLDAAGNRTTVTTTRQFDNSWQAQGPNLGHVVGYADSGGWADDVNQPVGYMVYGPYTSAVPSGSRVATFRVLIDNNSADDAQILQLDVNDFDGSQIIASKILTRRSWQSAYGYEVFEVPFTMDPSRASHRIEFRVLSFSRAYIRVERVGYY